ncbi:hypothetical protein NQ317_012606 [Molorchus minor]|uniref:Axin n=1 Tax=Molorchus minor TaxID=1323400 RepID=A0ABQ9JJ87_9CUCU|nr:hypothetical protein NQ317_012606 [Molorchus minor]
MSEGDKNKAGGDQRQQNIYEGSFDHKSPRPPCRERKGVTSCPIGGSPRRWTGTNSSLPLLFPERKAINQMVESSVTAAPGPEQGSSKPDGSVRTSSRPSSRNDTSPPACLRWAQSLQTLLEDPEGVKVFQHFLESEGPHFVDCLDFWFAVEGLRRQIAEEKIIQLVKLIYRKFILKCTLPIDEELRKEIGRLMRSPQCLEPPETYLQYIENVQNPSSGSSSSEFSSNEISNLASGPDPLPTLHEDMELVMNPMVHISHNSGTGSVSTGYHTPNLGASTSGRLTKDLLLLSQKHRAVDVKPKTETFASMFMYRANLGAHAAYNSYNPVSRQDSELHSVSSHSDARTESDNMSLTDSSVVSIANSASPWIRTPFASILIEKLEMVKKQQDQQQMLDRKLKEVKEGEAISSMSDIQSRELANAIREKLQLEDDNDQDILDQHVSRVFSDLTPARSPGLVSPRPHSPPRNRHMQSAYMRPRRRDKDGFSTFSSDSGNVHDYTEGSEHKLTMVKSKSMPEYGEGKVHQGKYGKTIVFEKGPDRPHRQRRVRRLGHPAGPPAREGQPRSGLADGIGQERQGQPHTQRDVAQTSQSQDQQRYFAQREPAQEGVWFEVQLLGEEQRLRMPPLPSPNTAIQLEEAKRRLEDDVRNKTRQKLSMGKNTPEFTQSSQSTLRKSMRGSRAGVPIQTPSEEVTTVVFTFCEEQFPYRTKIPGTQITLRQFKEYLPKRGNYSLTICNSRYFFKTILQELGNQVIQEEIINDGDVLPLWEGKIMAQVKPID